MVRRGAKRPENQVRRFPVEKYREAGIGVHFPQAKPGLHVFPIAPKARFSGFIIRGAAIL